MWTNDETCLMNLLEKAVREKVSDLHIAAGAPPVFRIDGVLRYETCEELTFEGTEHLFNLLATAEQKQIFMEIGEIDFAFTALGGRRFRVNAFRQRGTVALALRLIADHIPSLAQLYCPESLKALALKPNGLVIAAGPTGSGKSTTLAALIQFINQTRCVHIITLEEPIEYVYEKGKSLVQQREIPTDSHSFSNGLRAALREDPDVILVGEMRDAETIQTAITAAETGHLIFATLHTGDAVQTLNRIIDAFPPFQQQQIKSRLAMTLQGIISQRLLARQGGGRIAAMEILIATSAIRNLIREGKTHQILSHMQTGVSMGMQTLDMALAELVRQKQIAHQTALLCAHEPELFRST